MVNSSYKLAYAVVSLINVWNWPPTWPNRWLNKLTNATFDWVVNFDSPSFRMSSSVYNFRINIINSKLQEQHQRQSVSTKRTSRGSNLPKWEMIPKIIEREKSKSQSFREREPTTEQGRESNQYKRVILTVISVRDRNRNTSEWMKAWISSNVN